MRTTSRANNLNFLITGDDSALDRALSNAGQRFAQLHKDAVASIAGVGNVFEHLQKQMQSGFQLDSSSLENAARRAESVFNETRTASERAAAKQSEINQLYQKGAIDTDTYGRAMTQLKAQILAATNAPIQEFMRKAEVAFNETRTAEEKLIAKQKDLEAVFKSGAMDADTYARALTKIKGEAAALANAPLEATMRKGEAVFNSTRTATEQLAIKVRELNQLHKAGAIDTDTYTRALKQAESAVGQNATAFDRFKTSLSSSISNLKSMAVAYAGFQTITGIGHMAEEMTNLDAQIRRTTASESEFGAVQNQLKGIAMETRAGLSETVKLYARSATALKEYGYGNQEVLKFTELTNKAMATGGASAAEQSAALQQLAQALASGKLQGDEFRSMAENSPIFLDIMSKSLGVTRGELRKMSSDGKLTTDVIMKSVMGQSEMIDKAFKKMPITVGGAIQQVKTSMMGFFDTALVQSGVMTALANAISGVAKHFGTLAIAATTIGAVALANVAIGAVAAGSSLLTLGQAALSASRTLLVAAFSNPFTAVIAGAGLAIAALYEFRDTTVEINGVQTTISDVASDVWATVKSVASDAWDAVKSAANDGVAAVSSWFPSLEINWSSVWSGIKSVTGSVCATIYDMTFGLGTNMVRAFQWAAGEIRAIIAGIVDAAVSMANSVSAAVSAIRSGDFSGAGSAIKGTFSAAGDAYSKARGQMGDFKRASTSVAEYIGEKFSKAASLRNAAAQDARFIASHSRGGGGGAAAAVHHGAGGGGGGGGKKGGGGGGGGGKAESKMSGFDEELTALKRTYELAHDLRELSKVEEVAYWKSKLLTVTKGSKDAAAIDKKIAQLSFENDKSALKNKLALAELSADQLLKVEGEKLDEELKFAQFRNEIGSISGSQLLAVEADIESRRFELARKSMQDRIALLEKDPTKNVVEVAKINAQIEDLARAHNTRLADIDRKSIKEKKTMWAGVTSTIDGLWDKGLDALMNGTLTWKNATKAVIADLGKAFSQMAGKMAKDWIKQNAQKFMSDKATQAKQFLLKQVTATKELLLKKTTAAKEKAIDNATQKNQQGGLLATLKQFIATIAKKLAVKMGFATQEKAIEATSVATSSTANIAKATTAVGANAVTAASGAAASQASIPWVGPVLAIAAMAAMMAAVGGMSKSIPSARGGYDIPAGMNPLTQLHEQEMVLPAKHADVIRSLANGGGSQGGGENYYFGDMHYVDSSGRLTPEEIRRNGKVFAEEMMRQTRNFKLKKS